MPVSTVTVQEEAFEKLHGRGWNFYDAGLLENEGAYAAIRYGPAGCLQIGCSYVLLPAADDPVNYNRVTETFDALVAKLGGEWPSMTIGGDRIELDGLAGFTLGEDDVYIHTPTTKRSFSYKSFLEELNSITKAN